MTELPRRVSRIACGAVLFAAALLTDGQPLWVQLCFYLAAYFICGGDVVLRACKNLFSGQVFDENFLMALATAGAFIIGEYPEAVGVMLFYQVGEAFQYYAVDKSRRSIADLMEIRPDHANLEQPDGTLAVVDPEDVEVGTIIVVKPGERIPLDGVVIEGEASVDTAALTGEAVPRKVRAGEELLSGCINLTGLLRVRVTKEFSDSTVNKILDLVENASVRKSRQEQFITKFARYYTPAVVLLAALLAFGPWLAGSSTPLTAWIMRAFTFLVISCPCALVISVPLSFFGGIGGASKQGILVKGGNYLEALAAAKTAVFDKTGTLTKGVFAVQRIYPAALTEEELLAVAAAAESYSDHPIALSLKEAYGQEIDKETVKNVHAEAGRGISAEVCGRQVLVGNAALMEKNGLVFAETEESGTVIYVAVDRIFGGSIVIADEIKADAQEAIRALKKEGVKNFIMLTGDKRSAGEKIASFLGIGQVRTDLLPQDKVTELERIMQEQQGAGKVIFVGDGINDAPVLARADVGIAMGALGSDAAIEAADVVIMNDEPMKIALAMKIGKKTVRIATQNIVFALGVKGVVLVLGALGLVGMWAAVFADVGVAVLAILNAMRLIVGRA